ncbi:hypothetical protein SpiGrapes_1085 [Sphaerochaeta pleomorpha str. Grapes]|uniref:Capsule assembly protein Wzi n=1 Tax=Sphaerochaeta pleomorpha (strain ATCC BAA-1885 / DSM 22778 / Grapes) TaxID=158190 RepID=G8QS47_SPHPG|nr:hypothetical protein [Sphaerochaeta pleomorpha]AEV28908.1 hypothetical protein SpiGrapes_1085 [Sphaerochaeta pleomorpha str. Grapes]
MKKSGVLKKVLFGFVLVLLVVAPLSAAIHSSVPIGHRVYRLLDVAEIRGLIDRQVATRPYSADKIMRLLTEIQEQGDRISSAENQEITALLAEFTLAYGKAEHGFDEVLSTGFIRTYDEKRNIGASMGVELTTSQTFLLGTNEYDSRNSVLAFLKGDLGDTISLNMNFGLLVDKINNRVFLPTEFTIPCEGFYMQLLDGGSQLTTLPALDFYSGLSMFPELSASFLGGDVNLRWGSIRRDWGPGLNNLLISGSARTIDGVEAEVELSHWLRYSVMTGSLGIFSLDTIDGDAFFSDWMHDKSNYRFDNNISSHRVEVDLLPNLTFSLYESVVWKKRFELGYLNPLAVYMFEQNTLGDLDDVLAGLDVNYTIAGKARFYGALAASEMHDIGSLKTMLTAPRNIMAMQAGVVIPLALGSFSALTFQWTYIAPFFYSHYPTMEKVATIDVPAVSSEAITTDRGNTITPISPSSVTVQTVRGEKHDAEEETLVFSGDGTRFTSDGRIKIVRKDGQYSIYETTTESSYVNKGEPIGYPLNPNSQEFLLQLDMAFEKGWTTCSTVKYQARSGQYGYDIAQYMFYEHYGDYPAKAFWSNIFEHALTLQLEVNKKLPDMPIEMNAAYRFTTTWARDIVSSDPDGMNTVFSAWNDPVYDNALTVGAKIFF